MELTVCICTHNRPHYLRDCLAGVTRQTAHPTRFAILVVDSGSDLRAAEEIRRLLTAVPRASLIRIEQPGLSLARNTAAWACHTPYIAYLDDDAIPTEGWVDSMLSALACRIPPPAVLGGRVLPLWEAPLPAWWPDRMRGVLSIIEAEGQGDYGDPSLPPDLAPFAVNMVVNVLSLLAVGGFGMNSGRYGTVLLSDEDVQLAWRLRAIGQAVRYDSRIVVYHRIQAARLTPGWLLSRLYWQGASTVLTRRLLGQQLSVWRELPRRIAVALLCAPTGLLPRQCRWLIGVRWRLAYALGFIRAAFGWQPASAARRAAAAASVAAARDSATVDLACTGGAISLTTRDAG
jgi:glycosyltransferase involved in cell wall biosynthesis